MVLDGWDLSAKKFIFRIDSSNVDTTLSGVPVLFKLAASCGTTAFDNTSIFTSLEGAYAKIAVEHAESGTQCYVEVERWDYVNNVAELWVRAPYVLSDAATDFYVYYDSTHADNTEYVGSVGSVPGRAVWDDDFVAVYHLCQNPAGGADSILNSKSASFTGDPVNMDASNLVDGYIGKGLTFNGTNEYITGIADHADWDIEPLTLEVLITDPNEAAARDIFHHGDYTLSNQQGITYTVIDNKLRIVYFNSVWRYVYSVETLPEGVCHTAFVITTTQFIPYFNGMPQTEVTLPAATGNSAQPCTIGAHKGGATYASHWIGVLDELRYSKVQRSSSWLKFSAITAKDLVGSWEQHGFLTFSNVFPSSDIKVYGLQQTLQIDIATLSGSPSSFYDASFYLGSSQDSGSLIGATISGAASGDTLYVSLSTLSGSSYSWYVGATLSGESSIEYSPIYSFYVRYLCSGTCSVNGTALSGATIYLHNRATGALIGTTTTAGEGTFNIDSQYTDSHYVVALHPDPAYNGLIYDRVLPE